MTNSREKFDGSQDPASFVKASRGESSCDSRRSRGINLTNESLNVGRALDLFAGVARVSSTWRAESLPTVNARLRSSRPARLTF